jgi:hypothetical protein
MSTKGVPAYNRRSLVGQPFEQLTVVAELNSTTGQLQGHVCECTCGSVILVRWTGNLTSGNSTSCGSCNRTKHGHAVPKSRTYTAWQQMWSRCTWPSHASYKNYGGKGIAVCERWKTFEAFLEDMGECPPGLTLERRDNARGYYKSNCRWATMREQQRNKSTVRLSAVRVAEIFARKAAGERAATIARALGVSRWTVGDALNGRTWTDQPRLRRRSR